MSKDGGRSRVVGLVAWRKYGSPVSQIADRNDIDLNRWFGKFGNAQHRAGGRGLAEHLGEDTIHFLILADVLEINLSVDHVIHGQTRRLDDRLDVIESLPHLRRKSRGQSAVRAARALS